MTPRPTICPSLTLPAPLILSPILGFWGVGKGLDRQVLADLALNCEGGKAVLGRLGEALGRQNRGWGRRKTPGFCLLSRVYIEYNYIGEFREGI